MNDASAAQLRVRSWIHRVDWTTEPPTIIERAIEDGRFLSEQQVSIADALARGEFGESIAARLRPYVEE